MISITPIIVILFAHWVADFVMQNDWMAKGKSKSNIPLLVHGATYTTVITVILSVMAYYLHYSPVDIIWFGIINGVLHTATDYVTSRLSSAAISADRLGGKIPNLGFFTIIGLDQMLHFIMLFYTWTAIFN